MEGTTKKPVGPKGPAGNTAHCIIPVDYRVHILVYLYTFINTAQHSHESGPKLPILLEFLAIKLE